MAEQTENLTYRQLADRLGLSLEAARTPYVPPVCLPCTKTNVHPERTL